MMKRLLSYTLLVVLMFGLSLDADAQRKKKDKKKKNGKKEQVEPQQPIMITDTSKYCPTFLVDNPDLARISREFAYMDIRRQVGDILPEDEQDADGKDYSAYSYWQKVYKTAPGFDIRVYTTGSSIHREMALKAKEADDTELMDEKAAKALELLEKGEECFPGGCFGPAKAYIYEIIYPHKVEEIYGLYTSCDPENLDPYSMISISNYGFFMVEQGKLDSLQNAKTVSEMKAVAASKQEDKGFKYALEQMKVIGVYYAERAVERAKQMEEAEQKRQEKAANNQSVVVYNEMLAANKAGDRALTQSKFLEYMQLEEDPARRYQIAMYIGGSHAQAEDYPRAREAYLLAIAADDTKGDAYYRIGSLYLSSGPICGPGTGFDSQRVIWPAFDQLEIALSKEIDQETRDSINSLISEFKVYLPTTAQIAEQGLNEGDIYTVTCWINLDTVVRAKK